MDRNKNSSLKTKQIRKRVQKHRNLKKIKELYEREVQRQYDLMNITNSDADDENNHAGAHFADHDDDNDKSDLAQELRSWAITHRIKQTATNVLLKILIATGFTVLPKDSRTLLKTPQSVEITPLGNGHIWYYTVRKCLECIFVKINSGLEIHLDFNFDGLPLFNSSQQEFWPMLASVRGKS